MAGERLQWYRLARELHEPNVDVLQESITSTQFLEWHVALQELDTQEALRHDKQDYYLAQIAALLKNVIEGFAKNPKPVSVEDMLIPLGRADAATDQTASTTQAPPAREKRPKLQPLEAPTPDLDEGWARVNANAKAAWAAYLGVGSLEELKIGDRQHPPPA